MSDASLLEGWMRKPQQRWWLSPLPSQQSSLTCKSSKQHAPLPPKYASFTIVIPWFENPGYEGELMAPAAPQQHWKTLLSFKLTTVKRDTSPQTGFGGLRRVEGERFVKISKTTMIGVSSLWLNIGQPMSQKEEKEGKRYLNSHTSVDFSIIFLALYIFGPLFLS